MIIIIVIATTNIIIIINHDHFVGAQLVQHKWVDRRRWKCETWQQVQSAECGHSWSCTNLTHPLTNAMHCNAARGRRRDQRAAVN